MSCLELEFSKENKFKEDSESEELTLDGSVNFYGRPAIRAKSGRWSAATIILSYSNTYEMEGEWNTGLEDENVMTDNKRIIDEGIAYSDTSKQVQK